MSDAEKNFVAYITSWTYTNGLLVCMTCTFYYQRHFVDPQTLEKLRKYYPKYKNTTIILKKSVKPSIMQYIKN